MRCNVQVPTVEEEQRCERLFRGYEGKKLTREKQMLKVLRTIDALYSRSIGFIRRLWDLLTRSIESLHDQVSRAPNNRVVFRSIPSRIKMSTKIGRGACLNFEDLNIVKRSTTRSKNGLRTHTPAMATLNNM